MSTDEPTAAMTLEELIAAAEALGDRLTARLDRIEAALAAAGIQPE
jgi:hypothetical protein